MSNKTKLAIISLSAPVAAIFGITAAQADDGFMSATQAGTLTATATAAGSSYLTSAQFGGLVVGIIVLAFVLWGLRSAKNRRIPRV